MEAHGLIIDADEQDRQDAQHLASVKAKLARVRRSVISIVLGYEAGLYLFGEGGTGKSWTVLTTLATAKAEYKHYNSRLSARKLFDELRAHPEHIHVIEDAERLTNDLDAQGVLRSALAPPHLVTWNTAAPNKQKVDDPRFTFAGGIVIIGNRPMRSLPELRALAKRIDTYHLDLTIPEMAALMRDVARAGHTNRTRLGIEQTMTPEECRQVADLVIRECAAAGLPPTMRTYVRSLKKYLFCLYCPQPEQWPLVVAEAIVQEASHFGSEETVLAEWLGEACVTGTGYRVRARDLLKSYRAWCKEAGEKALTEKAVGQQLTARGFERLKTGGVIWRLGIALAPQKGPRDRRDGDS